MLHCDDYLLKKFFFINNHKMSTNYDCRVSNIAVQIKHSNRIVIALKDYFD